MRWRIKRCSDNWVYTCVCTYFLCEAGCVKLPHILGIRTILSDLIEQYSYASIELAFSYEAVSLFWTSFRFAMLKYSLCGIYSIRLGFRSYFSQFLFYIIDFYTLYDFDDNWSDETFCFKKQVPHFGDAPFMTMWFWVEKIPAAGGRIVFIRRRTGTRAALYICDWKIFSASS